MHIAMIAPSRFPIRQPFVGGLEAFVWHLTRRLQERGHKISLHAPAGSDEEICAELVEMPTHRMSAAAAQEPHPPSPRGLSEHHAYLDVVRRLASSPADVVHNNSFHHYPVALSELIPAPMLTTLHTPPLPYLESALRLGDDPRRRFVAVSRAMRDLWPRPGIDVVHNGVDTDLFRPGPGGDQVAWVGRITPEKGTHLAIDACRAAGRRLVLAGAVYDAEYYAQAIVPRLGPDVQHVGRLTQQELPELYGTSAATLVTPCWEEPFGLVVAESLCCGTPVVALARGGLPEIVRDRITGRLCHDSADLPAALADAVALDRADVAAEARRTLSMDRMVSRYEELYRAVARSGAGGVG